MITSPHTGERTPRPGRLPAHHKLKIRMNASYLKVTAHLGATLLLSQKRE